ncbi:Protein NipSnap-like protein [Hapsidospora chrysogenum ATCC 11550]|uniref:Protein NipSnap-like protein n=1 Tax=Hapsidospora chrysogenum (strain ATCC 11550 / CBS 779.69 / DSM 880 / IAM 14645 / JCM 23072 / IMI 49137) TaxID=857340 RepID=A0A086SYK2_HAPC1|nr:Protein NipSnap-like protein [Hapsidospora chrysogenum ATCC 11550]
MLCRNITRVAATTPRSGVRALSSTAMQQSSAPSMGDINPSRTAVDSFNKKQKAFREQLLEAQKEREARALAHRKQQAASSQSAQAPTNETTGATAEKKHPEPSRKTGPLTNLIYGTKEGRELDAQIEASFSQVLARGKYVHSIVFHEVKPDKVDEYVKLVGEWYPKMANLPENKVHLVGSWRTEVGDCDTFVHIWEYQKYEGYHDSRYNITHHPEYADFERKLATLISSKKISLMQEFSFWPTTPPRQLGGVFELRSYTLHPGNLLEWETHWRRGLKARREVMEGVGAWFVQIGDLNTVHHLWQFANLEERRARREQSWSIEGWSDTVHKTVPLIQEMKSRILIPMPWSPVA